MNKKTLIIIAVAVIVLALGGYLIYKQSNKDSKSQDQEVTTQVTTESDDSNTGDTDTPSGLEETDDGEGMIIEDEYEATQEEKEGENLVGDFWDDKD